METSRMQAPMQWKWLVLASLVSVLAGCRERSQPTNPERAADAFVTEASVVDAALRTVLAAASPTDRLAVILNYDDARTTRAAITDAVLDLGAGVVQYRNLSMLAALATPEQVVGMQGLTGVQSVVFNRRLDWLLAESRATIRADEVHAAGITGAGVGIAILDSGIDGLYQQDLAYPDKTVQNVKYIADLRDLVTFGGGLDSTVNMAPALFVENLPNSETSVGHGTHVAGIAAGSGGASSGTYTGVAPGAHLVGIGTGDVLFIFWALAGFDYVLEHHEEYNIQVVNNSWGTTGEFDPADPINEATRALHDAGVTVVFAAGNAGPGENTLNPYGVAPWTIGVAAGCKLGPDPTNSASQCQDPTGAGRDPVLAQFSSRGIPGDALYHPDVTAPGVRIVSTRASTGTVLNVLDAPDDLMTCNIGFGDLANYTCASGTSMAAPHIAGVVALMEQAAGGELTPDEALEILTSTARPLDGYSPFEVGAGYVDAFAAVDAASR